MFGLPLTVGPTNAKPTDTGNWVICDKSFSLVRTPGEINVSCAMFLIRFLSSDKYIKYSIKRKNLIVIDEVFY
jgi:hypothetical protein